MIERGARVAVVGGGVIGLSAAWRAARAGYRVELIDPAPGTGASAVAGGMLAPIAEAWPSEEGLLELGSASLARWPAFAEDLAETAGTSSGLRHEGTFVVGVDSADRADLDRHADYLDRLGRSVTRYTGRDLRRAEPSLGPAVRRGLAVPGDLAVDNRVALAALRGAAVAAGVSFRAERVTELGTGYVRTEQSEVDCSVVVLAAGAHSARLHPALSSRLRPVKGEVLRLRARTGALPPPRRTVRGPVHGRPVYLVPRDDGGLVLGATQYEAGYDTDVTLGGVRDLINDAEELMPGLSEYELVEARAGLRPTTDDNMPVLGWLEPGVLAATGHYRGGFLLAPITADTVVALLRGEQPPAEAGVASPARWEERTCAS